MTPLIRRILLIAIFFGLAVLGTVLLIFFLSKDTLGLAQKCSGANCWGYQLEHYTFSKRNVLTFTGSWGLHLQFDLPKTMTIQRANDDRWLATDRALYLNLRAKQPNDPGEGTPIRIIYDFQRGETYVSSPLQLWRAGDASKTWMTETEFQRVLNQIEP